MKRNHELLLGQVRWALEPALEQSSILTGALEEKSCTPVDRPKGSVAHLLQNGLGRTADLCVGGLLLGLAQLRPGKRAKFRQRRRCRLALGILTRSQVADQAGNSVSRRFGDAWR